MEIKSYKDLKVYQRAMELVIEIYQITRKLPDTEKFGLVSQMRRCAVSVPSNIAEGQQRDSLKDYLKFLYISRGSLAELETQINIVKELDKNNKLDFEKIENLLIQTRKMLCVLIKKLAAKLKTKHLKPET